MNNLDKTKTKKKVVLGRCHVERIISYKVFWKWLLWFCDSILACPGFVYPVCLLLCKPNLSQRSPTAPPIGNRDCINFSTNRSDALWHFTLKSGVFLLLVTFHTAVPTTGFAYCSLGRTSPSKSKTKASPTFYFHYSGLFISSSLYEVHWALCWD